MAIISSVLKLVNVGGAVQVDDEKDDKKDEKSMLSNDDEEVFSFVCISVIVNKKELIELYIFCEKVVSFKLLLAKLYKYKAICMHMPGYAC